MKIRSTLIAGSDYQDAFGFVMSFFEKVKSPKMNAYLSNKMDQTVEERKQSMNAGDGDAFLCDIWAEPYGIPFGHG